MKKKSRIGLNIGTSSILLVFVLLCMVTFAALSFVSANADYKLSQSLETRTTRYYTVSNTAEQRLSEIEDILAEVKSRSADFESYKPQAAEALAESPAAESPASDSLEDLTTAQVSDSPQGTATASGSPEDSGSWGTLHWQLPFSDTQALDVVLNLTDPFESGSYFTVNRWQVVSTVSWEDDSTLELFDGQ